MQTLCTSQHSDTGTLHPLLWPQNIHKININYCILMGTSIITCCSSARWTASKETAISLAHRESLSTEMLAVET